MKKIKNTTLAIAMGLGLTVSSLSFAQSLSEQYGVSNTAETVSGTTEKGLSYVCGPTVQGGKVGTKCTYGDGIVVTTNGEYTAVLEKDGSVRHFNTNDKLLATLQHLDYTMQNTVNASNSNNTANAPTVIGNSSSGSDSGMSDVATGMVVAGALGAGAAVVGEIIESASAAGVLSDAQTASNAATQVSATGIEGSMKELDKLSDGIAGAAPKHDLRFGPTPTGDVFTFCAGPRPGRHSTWRYWWDYLCSHGKMSIDLK